MKIKFSLWLLVVGYAMDFIGAWMKIVHRPHADFMLAVSAIVKVVALFSLIYFLLSHPRVKEFLEVGEKEAHK